jgi:hypothetical protein
MARTKSTPRRGDGKISVKDVDYMFFPKRYVLLNIQMFDSNKDKQIIKAMRFQRWLRVQGYRPYLTNRGNVYGIYTNVENGKQLIQTFEKHERQLLKVVEGRKATLRSSTRSVN